MDYEEIITRIYEIKKLNKKAELPALFGLETPNQLRNRINRTKKQKITPLMQAIVELGITENVDLNWLIKGKSHKTEDKSELSEGATKIINRLLDKIDRLEKQLEDPQVEDDETPKENAV